MSAHEEAIDLDGGVWEISTRMDRLRPNRFHRKATFLIGVGGLLEFYEILIGGILAGVLAEEWNLTTGQKALVISSLTVGFFFGANIFTFISDKLGRRRAFLLDLLFYSLLSIVSAFSPNLWVLVALRFLVGIGAGAQLMTVDTYMSELMPKAVRGRYLGWSHVVGNFAGPVAGLLAIPLIGEDDVLGLAGWRWMLIFAGLGGIVAWVIRRNLPESPRWLAARGRHSDARRVVDTIERAGRPASNTTPTDVAEPQLASETDVRQSVARQVRLTDMFRPPYRRRTIMLWVFQLLQSVGFYGFTSLATLVIVSKGFTITESVTYTAIGYLAMPVSAVLAVLVIDRMERKHLLVVTAAAMAVVGLAFGSATTAVVIAVTGVLYTLASGVFSATSHVYPAEIYPTSIRSRATGIAYSLSRASQVLVPFGGLALLDRYGATAVYATAAGLITVLCLNLALLGPRTTARSLEEI